VKSYAIPLSVLLLIMTACQSQTVTTQPQPSQVLSITATTTAASTPTDTPLPVSTSTSTPSPAGVIQVDTLDQEVYPFKENGKCSLAEAIFAANSGKPRDSCAAGVPGKSVIELMPGEYHFTQRDQTPPQVDWLTSVVSVGDALPPVIFPLTIHGHDAVLVRDEGAEPFRFFEVLVNSGLALDHLALQGGDAGEDWGGAIYAMSALVDLDHVSFINNHAYNGGAIYFDLSALTIRDGELNGNSSTFSGGALYITSSRTTIDSTHFEENQSGGDGGAVYAETANFALANSIMIGNRVTGENYGTRGGGLYLDHVNLSATGSQFYKNEAPMYGGAISINNPILAGIDPEDGDPMEPLKSSPVVSDMLTSIPGFQATLEAHPSGIFVEFHEDAQIHNNCFANNITINPQDPNWTSGLLGRASAADGNYWGHASGPSGMGPGKGDSVGKRLTFAPFLTERPEFCDVALAERQE
jgi:predicted outer membrane repeat protein